MVLAIARTFNIGVYHTWIHGFTSGANAILRETCMLLFAFALPNSATVVKLIFYDKNSSDFFKPA